MDRIKNYKELYNDIIEWIKSNLYENGKYYNAVLKLNNDINNIIVIKLCVDAIGAERVILVQEDPFIIPNVELKNVKNYYIHTDEIISSIIRTCNIENDDDSETNLSKSLLNSVMNYIGENTNGKVITSRCATEVFYDDLRKYSPLANSIEPLAKLTLTEMLNLGKEMNIILSDEIFKPYFGDIKLCENIQEEYDIIDSYISDENSISDELRLLLNKKDEENNHFHSLFFTFNYFYPNDILDLDNEGLECFEEFKEKLEEGFEEDF